jgi:hypothetical protein
MELIQSYLERCEKVGGLYVMQVAEGFNMDELNQIMNDWESFEEKKAVDAPLLIIPDSMSVSYERRFTFERAMQLVRSGMKVRRLIWNPDHYLELCEESGSVFRERGYMRDFYHIIQDDLEAVDWVLHGKVR